MTSSIPVTLLPAGRAFFDGATQAAFDMRADPKLEPVDTRLEPLADFWHRWQWRGRLPRRSDFTPEDFRSLLGHLLLLDRLDDRVETRFRLVGTAFTGLLDRDMTGRSLRQSYAPALAERMLEQVDLVVETRLPVRLLTHLRTENGGTCDGEAILVPLFSDQQESARVSMILCGASWRREQRGPAGLPPSHVLPWDNSLLRRGSSRIH